jgi:transposase
MSNTELMPKPKVGGEPAPAVHRMEVFTGTGRRRRWTAEQKALIIAEAFETGETVSAVARRHGLTPQQLFTWRRAAERGSAGTSRMTFAPVILGGSQRHPSAVPIAQGHSGASPVIEIVIGAATVRVPPETEFAVLQLVLRALTATP